MFTQDMQTWLPETPAWVPAECDVPIRGNHWFWHPADEDCLRSLDSLVDIYCRSVGHGTNLLLNIAPDDRGLLPEVDVERVLEFGMRVRHLFGVPLAETSGSGGEIVLDLPRPALASRLALMEDISLGGERVREYKVEALVKGRWQQVASGTAIGHKKIDLFEAVETSRLRWRSVKATARPLLRRFAVHA